MNAFAAFKMSFSGMWSAAPTLAEPELVCKPRPMTGFLATLSADQKSAAKAYRGEENHGDAQFAK